MKFELKHLSPYLDHRLKIQGQTHGEIQELSGLREGIVYTIEGNKLYGWTDIFNIKPILRSLSDPDLLSLLSADGISVDYDLSGNIENIELLRGSEWFMVSMQEYFLMLEKHADLYNLIRQNLAIDMNTIKQSVTT